MTDPTFPPSARRFASFLEREYCVWMPSPSVALLSALVTGKERPKRLLVQENAPAFISNIGRIAGAITVKVSPQDIDDVLQDLLGTQRLSPDHVWGLATHRDGKLSPTDWLSRCAASKVPTVELCMGSLFELVRWSLSPATFTIVDLDAEAVFANAQLTALIAGDRMMAGRVQRLCLPRPGVQDYILDAWPRGLAHDEAAIATLVERAMAPGGEKPAAAGDTVAFARPAAMRLPSAERDGFVGLQSPALPDPDPWRARLTEAEARHAEEIRDAKANAGLLQARIEQQQRTIDQWETRFQEAESEAAQDAAFLTGARADLLRVKSESERALASMQAEREALTQKVLRAEKERDLALADAARRDEASRRTLDELRQRVAGFEKAAAASAEREARLAEEAEASRTQLSARVVRLEADAVAFGKVRADLLKQKTEAEQALASIQAEKEALSRSLSALDAELAEALADAAKRTAAQHDSLVEQRERAARLERQVAELTEREATRTRQEEASRTRLSGRIAGLEAEVETLVGKLSAVEKDRDLALADAARREETERAAAAEQGQRAQRLEAETAALKEREAALTREWASARAGLSEQMNRLEAEATLAQKASAELRAARAAAENALAQARAENKAASEKLADVERSRAQAVGEAERSHEALRRALDEEKQRGDRLEKEAGSLRDSSASQVRDGEALRVALSERVARLEAEQALADQVREEMLAQKEEAERGRALLQSEKDALGRKLAGVESDRDRAVVDAEKQREALRAALAEKRRLEDQSEKDTEVLSVREARQVEAWESERAQLSDQIAGLQASAVEAQNAQAVLSQKAEEAAQAMVSMRAEAEAAARRLAEVEKARDLALDDAAGREETLGAALEEQRQRADRLEADAAVRTKREEQLTDDWALLRAEMSARIAGLEAEAVAANKARADLAVQKAEGDQSLDAIRADREGLRAKLAAMERSHALALADAARREDAQRVALDAEKRRSGQLADEAAALAEREAKLKRDWEDARAEWSERTRQFEAERAGNADVGLLAGKEEADQARASLQAQLEEQLRLVQQLKLEATNAAAREAKNVEASEASRAELQTRIARLEAAEVTADKARTELLNRKRDSDRALAEAQAERVGLLKKLAIAERQRDEAQAKGAGPATDHGKRPDAPAASRGPAGGHNTGGLTALVSLWNTGVTKRPPRGAVIHGTPAAPPFPEIPGLEAIPIEAAGPSGQDPAIKAPAPTPSDHPAPATPALQKQGRAAPANEPDAAPERGTGGLSALVNLWKTAATMRPFQRKETKAAPAASPPPRSFDIEVIADEAPRPNGPAPFREGPAPPESDRRAPADRALPDPSPQPPQPKPVAGPGEAEKAGGWLSGLAGRIRGKPK